MSLLEFDKNVQLYYSNNSHRGPGKVVQNLIKGLRGLGVTVVSNAPPGTSGAYNGWLQNCHKQWLSEKIKRGEPCLLGPNLFVVPSDDPQLCNIGEQFVVPSQWVKDLYYSFREMDNKKIHVWPVGIDTEQWAPSKTNFSNLPFDCFIYFKNRSEQDLAVAEAICRKFNLKYNVIRYGYYNETELLELCNQSKFTILLTGTESQGIAYMQILSANKPCYVFDNPMWRSEDKSVEHPATSVPYFDSCCGVKTVNVSLEHFANFIEQVNKQTFNPRDYILKHHTLEKSARNYLNLLQGEWQ